MSYRMLSKTKPRFGSSSSFSYPYVPIILPSDDFTGSDGAYANLTRWTTEENSGATVLINNNTLQLITPGTVESMDNRVTSNFDLSGDFDINVEYSLDTYPSTASWRLEFRVYTKDDGLNNTFCSISRAYEGGLQRYFGWWFNNTVQRTDVGLGTSLTLGLFRITRIGNTFTSYRDGVLLGTSELAFSDSKLIKVTMSLLSTGSNPSATIAFDNFNVVSAGDVIWP